ncbi:MAG TPA: hypothetical protein VFK54_13240 [Candidatus Limnocylindrales bacterium]|nr:hypothetical protein [Candidatus Limnocylindrales bacterium]
MTHVLVVHHDIDLADQEVESLRRFGYDVEQCSGPTANTCPVLRGRECVLATRADVLVYDAFADGDADGAVHLVERLHEVHPGIPIVLTIPGMGLDWMADAGPHRVVPLYGQPTGARLHEAIQQALTPGIAVATA